MIDVWAVLANSLWILGAAVLLAAISWAYWVANTQGDRIRTVMSLPGIQQALNGGLFLFCAGLAATSRAWWERLLWGLLAAVWMVRALRERINTHKVDTHKQERGNANPDENAL